jgi:chemotaxis protein histidine kinase CheA
VQLVSGATILGDGTVALILDPERLAQDAVRAVLQRTRGRPGAAGGGNRLPPDRSSVKRDANFVSSGPAAGASPQ